ncbi:MAG: dTDP-4-amino-4,6-dideoxygalactose transaminase [bacterium]|nr:dTDP-4-amino-4,6-dideoxygalactose transaminase [bacterium]
MIVRSSTGLAGASLRPSGRCRTLVARLRLPDSRGEDAAVGQNPGPHARVPFNRPYVAPKANEYVGEVLNRGTLGGGTGEFSRRCSELLEHELGVNLVILTASGTAALEACALLLDLAEGDEVILPSFTHPATANAFVRQGASPVFVDIRPDTNNLDERLVAERISSRTRAIVVMHYAGIGCEMVELCSIAERRGISLVEDAAQAIFAAYRGRSLGSFGDVAAVSFHETKNITCGEGGALLVNDTALTAQAEFVVENGTDRRRFLRGEVPAYTWQCLGSNYRISEILGAVLWAQLEERHRLQERRAMLWNRYGVELQDWARLMGMSLPVIPANRTPNHHTFFLRAPDRETRCRLIEHLERMGITATFHYSPLHLSTIGKHAGYRHGDLPVTEQVSATLVRLPLYNGMNREEQDQVIEALASIT